MGGTLTIILNQSAFQPGAGTLERRTHCRAGTTWRSRHSETQTPPLLYVPETEQECCQDDDDEPERTMPRSLGAILTLLALLAGLAAGFAYQTSRRPPSFQEIQEHTAVAASVAQANAQGEAAKANAAQQKRLEDLQLKVIQGCVDHGKTPSINGQNIECK